VTTAQHILRLPDGSPVFLDEPDFWRFWKANLFLHRGRVCLRDEQGRLRRLDRQIVEATPSHVVRILDGDPRNLKRSNLQVLECSMLIREQPAHGACPYKGVSPYRGKWQATIRVDGKLKGLGAFDTPEAAAVAYDDAVLLYRGKSGRLNFPQRPRRRTRQQA
jgi:hypothetical protein